MGAHVARRASCQNMQRWSVFAVGHGGAVMYDAHCVRLSLLCSRACHRHSTRRCQESFVRSYQLMEQQPSVDGPHCRSTWFCGELRADFLLHFGDVSTTWSVLTVGGKRHFGPSTSYTEGRSCRRRHGASLFGTRWLLGQEHRVLRFFFDTRTTAQRHLGVHQVRLDTGMVPGSVTVSLLSLPRMLPTSHMVFACLCALEDASDEGKSW